MKLHNTLTRKIEIFIPINPGSVRLYTCGPTVYDHPHIGNWAAYIRWDMLVRTLGASGYDVNWVMNITDVGHLTSDQDTGEDKLEAGARREGKTAWQIAEFYTDVFKEGLRKLNVSLPFSHLFRATDYIKDQIKLIEEIESKGCAYVIDDGVYFDTSKFKSYGELSGAKLSDGQAASRIDINPQKRNPKDFALWKFSPKAKKRDMEWWAPWQPPGIKSSEIHIVGEPRTQHLDAPLGAEAERSESYEEHTASEHRKSATTRSAKSASGAASLAGRQAGALQGSWGFPGWHIECSAIAMKYLGETLDIHAGGVDHIPTHHTNEIAQSETVTGRRFSRFWLHSEFYTINGSKISKSLRNGITLADLKKHKIVPLEFRLFVMQSHYRAHADFSWSSLQAASVRLKGLQAMADLRFQPVSKSAVSAKSINKFKDQILKYLQDDLNTPDALAALSGLESMLLGSGIGKAHIKTFNKFIIWLDELLGLRLGASEDINSEQKALVAKRAEARQAQQWAVSDNIRAKLEEQGIAVNDGLFGQIWRRI